MSRKRLSALMLALAVAVAGSGCTPGSEPESVTAFDTVTTLFDKNTDFAALHTFTVVDSVFHLVDPGQSDNISRAYDTQVLTQIRTEMTNLGWTEIANPGPGNAPDVSLNVAATTAENIVGEYWPPYWGYYPGYPGYGWGWGYSTIYNYTTGTLLMTMLDLKHPDPGTQTVPVVWTGALNGVLEAPGTVPERLQRGIDQAFDQSPYLGK